MSYYVSLESNKRTFGTPNNFTIPLVWDNPKSFAVKEISLTNNIYLINANNDFMTIDVGSIDYTVYLDHKNYTASQLASEIQTKLNALPVVGGGFTCVYTSQTNKFTFTNTSTWDIDFTLSGTDYLYKLLGFDKLNYTSSGPSNTITAPFQANLLSVEYIDFCSNNLGKAISNQNMNANAIERLFVNNAQYGEQIVYSNRYRKQFAVSPNTAFGQADITLRDQNGNLVDIENNVNVCVLLECFK
jgi:hypothetical protein